MFLKGDVLIQKSQLIGANLITGYRVLIPGTPHTEQQCIRAGWIMSCNISEVKLLSGVLTP